MLATLYPTDLGYRLLLLGHLLCVIVGFGATFVLPLFGREAGKRGGPGGLALSETATRVMDAVVTYPIYGAGAFGLALALAGDRMDEAWVGIAIALYVVSVSFAGFVHTPNLRRMDALAHELAAGGGAPGPGGPPPQVVELASRSKAAARNGGILHLSFVVLLVLMIWQPS
ncbi:MAG: hypothetical protein AB7H43_00995 [Acidimicrobiia bacterium]